MLLGLLVLGGCSGSDFSEEEKRLIAQLRLSQLGDPPRSAGNAHGDDPAAAALGEKLFFDTRLSGDGTVACATCHLPDRQFQDDRPLGEALGTTDRRTMPLAGAAHSTWLFWDGRADSLWAQALGPLEDAREHGGDRAALGRTVTQAYGNDYAAVFGATDDHDQNRVFANIGKALDAYIRTLDHHETRFDRFAEAVVAGRRPEGDAAFDSLEIEGLKLFIGKANCIDCHNGPRFTDEFFHNTGVPPAPGLPDDRGRITALATVRDDPFNCLGHYSDAGESDCAELRFMVREGAEFERAFKTPSLRGAAGRPPYMHAGQIATLDEVIDHYSRAPDAASGQSELQGVIFTDRGRKALVAFLKTLN